MLSRQTIDIFNFLKLNIAQVNNAIKIGHAQVDRGLNCLSNDTFTCTLDILIVALWTREVPT